MPSESRSPVWLRILSVREVPSGTRSVVVRFVGPDRLKTDWIEAVNSPLGLTVVAAAGKEVPTSVVVDIEGTGVAATLNPGGSRLDESQVLDIHPNQKF